jgi:hypothetical protein
MFTLLYIFSYLEIYKEHVRDLLRPPAKGTAQHNLKVREHPRDGIYVQGTVFPLTTPPLLSASLWTMCQKLFTQNIRLM